jgi:hypothetical protein
MNKTFEELEREAYITGDVGKAKLLGFLLDYEHETYRLENILEGSEDYH